MATTTPKPTTRATSESRDAHLGRYTNEGFTEVAHALGVSGTYQNPPGFDISVVHPGTAAETAGLTQGDTILEVDGVPVGQYSSRIYRVWKRYEFGVDGKVQFTIVYKVGNHYKYFYPIIQLDETDGIAVQVDA